MPNLPAHIDIAFRAAKRLGHPTIDSNIGSFLFGSTSPDIRVITKKKREEYHFVTLDFAKVGAGVEGLFNKHSNLRASKKLTGATQAFMSGYIAHLVTDETWIVNVFRPFFNNPKIFPETVLGKVMDRALQLELDRQSWEFIKPTIHLVKGADCEVQINFLPQETLSDWNTWVINSLNGNFSWERLRFMAKRIAAGMKNHQAHQIAEDFILNTDQGLENIYSKLPINALQTYRKQTEESLVGVIGEYLS